MDQRNTPATVGIVKYKPGSKNYERAFVDGSNAALQNKRAIYQRSRESDFARISQMVAQGFRFYCQTSIAGAKRMIKRFFCKITFHSVAHHTRSLFRDMVNKKMVYEYECVCGRRFMAQSLIGLKVFK
jgi:hypothetical protein